MEKHEYNEMRKVLKESREESLASKEKAFKALFDAGIITKTGRLRKVYRN